MPIRTACRIFLVCAPALLGACASQPAALEPREQVQMISALRAGKLPLVCGPSCRPAWEHKVRAISALNRAERWSDLAVSIQQTGYGNDLAYFYLGQAAQGMGYHQAAIAYYAQARALADSSDSTMQCAGAEPSEKGCQGIHVAAAAVASIAVSRAALQRDVAENAASQIPVRPHRLKVRLATSSAAGEHSAVGADGSAQRRVAGLAQAIDTATLQVHGRTVPLAGVVGRSDAFAAQLQALLDTQGSTVRCVPSGSAYACKLPNGLDVARAALANGIATVAVDAPAEFRAQQQAARAAHRGLWKSAGAGATG